MTAPRYCITIIILLLAPLAHADWDFRAQGNLLFSQTAYAPDDSAAVYTGVQTFNDIYANARLMAHNRWGRYDVDIHYQLGGISGDSLKIPSPPLGSGIGLPNDATRLFSLTQVLADSSTGIWGQRLDRFNVGYAGEQLVWRLGRQAVSWGDGLVFQPLDIFNPFSPLAIDTDYKTGDDLLYAQWLFASGNDLQLIYLPRRDAVSGTLSAAMDSTALKYHAQTSFGGWDLLLARHYDEDIVGLGHTRDVAGAVWRIDINHTRLKGGRDAVFAMTNMDYSWVWFNHNFYGFVEYYFNSLGADKVDFATLDSALTERLARGEIFTLGRNELATGLMMELSPRWQLNGTFITNLHDRSSMLVASGAYDWKENTKLQLGVQTGLGARNSEYGGLDTGPDGYLGTGTRFYLYLQQYY